VVSLVTGKYREFAAVDSKTLLWIVLAGLFGGIIGLFIYFVALQQGLTSRIVPIAATFPLFTAIYAFIFLNEPISFQRLAGIVLVVVELVLINWDRVVGAE
jgi:transporter family protein